MKVTIVHQQVPAGAAADERDVLDQAAAVRDALAANGHRVSVLPCTADLGNTRRKLAALGPDCVFNLVETLDGSGRLIHLAPAVWEAAGVPFTGSSAEALYLTTNKLLAKERLLAAGLPTPPFVAPRLPAPSSGAPSDWIVKSVWEHASVGLSDASVLRGLTASEAAARVPGGCFAERFIEGREFNLALLEGPDGPEALPPAEIVFSGYPEGKPRIVGYAAKWETGSFEYAHTVRRFADGAADAACAAELARLALRCWAVFGLRGYARVDFRLDAAGRPWILEVNANPCIAPDSGFAAMLAQAGIPYPAAVERIVRAAAPASAPAAPPAPPRRDLPPPPVAFRYEAGPSDVEAVREVTAATGYFHDHEIPVAVELVEERLAKGAASGYEFVFAECDGRVVGYTSFGPIPCTRGSFDWYWLAVRPESQGFGFGKRLLQEVEARARAMGGARLYCETSARPQYAATRAFYERMGFTLCEVLEDYYEPGDGRATYVKTL
jgi:D-alanine-D-alanine ligase-like ATP-grasp enzyme/ribosomal protein S18 acetylase RimI-like enzyme